MSRFGSFPFPVLGLSGGIASGKSHVAKLLIEAGWRIIDADQIARDVVSPGTKGFSAVLELVGLEYLNEDGSLNRRRLGAEVFRRPELRFRLESLLHPLIEEEIGHRLKALDPATQGVFLDAALWVEGGKAHHFDGFWVVEAPEALRIERLQARDRLSRDEAWARIQAQVRQEERALHASERIINDGRELEPQIHVALQRLLSQWPMKRGSESLAMTCPFSPHQLREILQTLLGRGGELGEIFVERRQTHNLGMDDGRMENVSVTSTFGASLRIIDEETTRFADFISPTFDELILGARRLAEAGSGQAIAVGDLREGTFPSPNPIERFPEQVPLSEKLDLVKRTEQLARQYGEKLRPQALRQVAVGYGDSTQRIWVAWADREGSAFHHDLRVQSVLRVSVAAGQGEEIQTGFQALGKAIGFELFTPEAVERTALGPVRMAIQALDAQPAPAGRFPVVLSSSAGGTMIHEACGHGLEADLALAGMSAFAGKIGEQVAAEGVTIVDDGTLPGFRGSSAMDDEGQPTQRVVLIEKGILKGYLQSRKTAQRMGQKPTGNGRRESYRHLPIPRMRNTFLAPGKDFPQDILKDLDQGLWVTHMGGGEVDTVSGNFVFQVTEGYWVEKGEVKHPIRNATLAGCGPEVLKTLQRMGSDLEFFDIGTCGKDGQGVPVSDALPTIFIPSLVVGGAQ